eukprot:CAMPEP_0201593838 /NCGR_PEP_ID=MMETSP0190_2-20130828/191341_1 /ASSEMBLY_ACC=CAM_ASM_000263 /TAXON_ID=37353 /ORGANISM="Rosalina sp." /LENGTH=102 /DNA_ID=CAMNT_0048053225 /DNA_START=1628 /DNA_END=1936 /DNA_ORIENTATION=+
MNLDAFEKRGKDNNNEYYSNDIGHHRRNNGLFTRISNDTITTCESNTDLVKIIPLKDSDEDQYLYSDESDDDTLELQHILNEDLSNDTIDEPVICISDSEAP